MYNGAEHAEALLCRNRSGSKPCLSSFALLRLPKISPPASAMKLTDSEEALDSSQTPHTTTRTSVKTAVKLALLSAALAWAAVFQYSHLVARSSPWELSLDLHQAGEKWNPQCPAQPKPLVPNQVFEPPESFRDEAAERLAQAVRIPTVSYDDNGPIGEDVGRGHFPLGKSSLTSYDVCSPAGLYSTTFINGCSKPILRSSSTSR